MSDRIDASRENRVLRLRVQELEKTIDYWRRRCTKKERERQMVADISREHIGKRLETEKRLVKIENVVTDLIEEIGRLHHRLIREGSAEAFIMDARLDRDRCPVCGSTDTGPSDYLYSDDGDIGVGLVCGSCGYTENVVVDHYRPFIRPGRTGSHDAMGDYGLQVAALEWCLPDA